MALLHLAAGWARDHGRRLLALTVDHRLHPDSAVWTARAGAAARAVAADWRALAWEGPKPATGLPAAARAARHRVIADAARDAGARVVLFAHTADDLREAGAMRAEGSTVGRPREWSPSPAWPEGRGLMLLRPMLGAGRAEVRAWLQGQGVGWIDDPANQDLRYARSRARAVLLPTAEGGARSGPDGDRRAHPPLIDAGGPLPLSSGEGSFVIDRFISAHALAAALVCAGGGDRPPRGRRLARLIGRLRAGETFTAALSGARLEADGVQVVVMREPGELARRGTPPLALAPGIETVWDGRWAVRVEAAGWSVAAAAGRRAALTPSDRAWLAALPPAARGAQPVLFRHDPPAAILAAPAGAARSLVENRLALALDGVTHERGLAAASHGARPRNHLFSR
jgi:tRNA(Ile)-lysidine synthase